MKNEQNFLWSDLEARERIINVVVTWNNIKTILREISVKMYSCFLFVMIGSSAAIL